MNLESYIQKDFDELVKELRWLYDGDRKEAEYHVGYIDQFTKAWRKVEVTNLETFKQYHREYIELAGALKRTGRIEERRFNQGFWEGLHQATRYRIERRMTDEDPQLDLTIPFPVKKVVAAAEHIYSRNRFDKHLLDPEDTPSRMRAETGLKRRQSKRKKSYDSSSDDSSSDSDGHTPRWWKTRTFEEPKAAPVVPKPEPPRARTGNDEINELIDGMEKLRITEPQYRKAYVKLSLIAPALCAYYQAPPKPGTRSYASQEVRFQVNDEVQRDPPPHLTMPPPDRRQESRPEPTCYGCGLRGHRMDQCRKIEVFVDQGHIRRIAGKIRWADGSSIVRGPDETWVDTITKRIHQEGTSTTTDDKGKGKGVYLVEIAREDSDADTDDQEELGWASKSAFVSNLQSYGAERAPRVSHDTRKSTQTNAPPSTRWMRELPTNGPVHVTNGKKGPVLKDSNLNRNQYRVPIPAAPTPTDVSPAKFEGKLDSELIPMDIDKSVTDERVENQGKGLTRNTDRTLRVVGQGRSKQGRVQSDVIKGIMGLQLALTLQDITCISPHLRRDLIGALRAMRDDPLEDDSKIVVGEDPAQKRVGEVKAWRTIRGNKAPMEPRSELLRIEVRIGKTTITGVIDSGSQVSMISADKLDESGLPSVDLGKKPLRIVGVNGATSECHALVPQARMVMVDADKETFCDLHVLEDADCDLLLGRPWSSGNGIGQEERERGTFLRWKEGDEWHEMNVSPAKGDAVRVGKIQQADSDDEGECAADKEDDEESYEVKVLAARAGRRAGTDLSYVPLSEGTRSEPDIVGNQLESEEAREAEEAERLAEERIARWEREGECDMEKGVDREKGDKREGDSERCSPPPNQQNKGKERARSRENSVRSDPESHARRKRPRRQEVIEVDYEVEEELTRLIQSGASDREWERFCEKEQRRAARKQQQWSDWEDNSVDMDLPLGNFEWVSQSRIMSPCGLEEPGAVAQSPPYEPSCTLETQPENDIHSEIQEEEPHETPTSTETNMRRTTRVKKRTERGRYWDEMVNKREYQRKDKTERKTSRRTGTASKSTRPRKVASYCLRILPDNGEESDLEDQREEHELGHVNIPEDPRSGQELTEELAESETVRLANHNIQHKVERKLRVKLRRPRDRPEIEPIWIPAPSQEGRKMGPIEIVQDTEDRRESDNEDDGTSIIEPVSDLVSPYEAEEDEGLTMKGRKTQPRTRPDSEIYPRPRELQNTKDLEGGKEVSYMRLPAPLVEKYDLEFGVRKRATKKESLRHHRPDLRNREVAERGRFISYDRGSREVRLSRSEQEMPETLTDEDHGSTVNDKRRTIPRRRMGANRHSEGPRQSASKWAATRANRNRALVQNEWVSSREEGTSSPSLEPRESPSDDEECSQCSLQEETEEGTSREMRAGSVRQIYERVSSKDIKAWATERRGPYLPSWLPTTPLAKLLSKFHKPTVLLPLLLILGPVVCLYLVTHHTTTHLLMAHLKLLTYPDDPSSNASQRPNPPSGSTDTRTTVPPAMIPGLDKLAGTIPAKAITDRVIDPTTQNVTPAIVAIQHLEFSSAESSPHTREFFGRATTVSIRFPTGKVSVYRGDVHLRLLARDVERGWGDVRLPSRAEVGHLRAILFREPGYEDWMERIRNEHRKVQPVPVQPTTDPRLKKKEEKEGRKDVLEKGIKIGPPSPSTREGRAPRSSNPTTNPGVSPEAGDSKTDQLATIKEEGVDNAPYKRALLARTTPESLSTNARPSDAHPCLKCSDDPRVSFVMATNEGGLASKIPITSSATYQRGEVSSGSSQETLFEDNTIRSPDDILPDLLDTLKRLQDELAKSFDREVQHLINGVEVAAGRVVEVREKNDKKRKDGDGDVVMREIPRSVRAPDYRPTSPEPGQLPDSPYVPGSPAQLRMDELEEGIRELKREIRDMDWRSTRSEHKVDERLDLLEGRLVNRESPREDDEHTWTVVRSARRRNDRDSPIRYATKPMVQRIEAKAETAIKDLIAVRRRMEEVERTAGAWDATRKKANALDVQAAGLEGEIAALRKKLAEAETRWKEELLRKVINARDMHNGRSIIHVGLLPRVSKLEARCLELEYRLATGEEQTGWTDQKVRAIWLAVTASNPADALIRSSNLLAIFNDAAAALAQRVENQPSASSDVSPISDSANTSTNDEQTLPAKL